MIWVVEIAIADSNSFVPLAWQGRIATFLTRKRAQRFQQQWLKDNERNLAIAVTLRVCKYQPTAMPSVTKSRHAKSNEQSEQKD